MPLFLLLVILPIIEIWLMIQVGSRIGALPTLGLVLLAAVLGVNLLRKQGASVLTRANQRMQMGEVPAREMVDGLFIALSGILLLIPGFLTDAVALLCLVPWLRRWLAEKSLHKVVFRSHTMAGGFGWGQKPGNDASGDIIEGEFQRQEAPRDVQKRLH